MSDKQTQSGEELQIVGKAAWKETEPKMRSERETCKRLEEEDDLRRRAGW